MSCADGSTDDALALKQRLAGHAKVLAQARRHSGDAHLPHVDYRARTCKADELVFLAFAMLEGPLCVVDTVASTGTAILYTTPAKRAGRVTFVQNVPEHFVRLDGPDTTVDQLLAAATQVAPALPAAGLAPRPRPAPTAMAAARPHGRPRTRALPPPPNRTRPAPPAPPPRLPGLHVDFDGGSRGNPGVGGAGSRLILVRDKAVTVLATRAVFLGDRRTTNNAAEFSGLVGGLELARDFLAQCTDPTPGLLVTVRGDSQLAIDLMKDRIECRDPILSALADQASALADGLEARGCEVAFQHVRREFNTEADALANAAMDTATTASTHTADFLSAHDQLPLLSHRGQDAAEPDQDAEPEDNDGDHPATLPPRRVPRLTALPSREELLGWLSVIHQDSRALGGLPPVRQWPAETQVAWTSACRTFAPTLGTALDVRDELALVQALLDLIELPTLVLRQHCPKHKPHDQDKPHAGADDASVAAGTARLAPAPATSSPGHIHVRPGDQRLRRAAALVYKDRVDKAMQDAVQRLRGTHTSDVR